MLPAAVNSMGDTRGQAVQKMGAQNSVPWDSNMSGPGAHPLPSPGYASKDQRIHGAGRILSNFRHFNSPSSFNSTSNLNSKTFQSVPGSAVPPPSYDVTKTGPYSTIGRPSNLNAVSPPRPSPLATTVADPGPHTKFLGQLSSSHVNQTYSSVNSSPSPPNLTVPDLPIPSNFDVTLDANTAFVDEGISLFDQEKNFDHFNDFPSSINPNMIFNPSQVDSNQTGPKVQQNFSPQTEADRSRQLSEDVAQNQQSYASNSVFDSNLEFTSSNVLGQKMSPNTWEVGNSNHIMSPLVGSEHAQFASSTSKNVANLACLADPNFGFCDETSTATSTCSTDINNLLASSPENVDSTLVKKTDFLFHAEPAISQPNLHQQAVAKVAKLPESPADQQASISPSESGYDSAEHGPILPDASLRLETEIETVSISLA